MTLAHGSMFLILAFTIQSDIVPLPPLCHQLHQLLHYSLHSFRALLQRHSTPVQECAADYYSCKLKFSHDVCRCDEPCRQFSDCCAESNCSHNSSALEFTCVSTTIFDMQYVAYSYWMIDSCPRCKSESVINGAVDLCEAQSLSSPPVSDNRTGLVYRNKYCAQCHVVPEEEQIIWRSEWYCNDSLMMLYNTGIAKIDIRNSSVTLLQVGILCRTFKSYKFKCQIMRFKCDLHLPANTWD